MACRSSWWATAPMDEPLAALVPASREAMVNAAKHAGVAEISVYAEVETRQVHVFVRDRGAGFDPAAVGCRSARAGRVDPGQDGTARRYGDPALGAR